MYMFYATQSTRHFIYKGLHHIDSRRICAQYTFSCICCGSILIDFLLPCCSHDVSNCLMWILQKSGYHCRRVNDIKWTRMINDTHNNWIYLWLIISTIFPLCVWCISSCVFFHFIYDWYEVCIISRCVPHVTERSKVGHNDFYTFQSLAHV